MINRKILMLTLVVVSLLFVFMASLLPSSAAMVEQTRIDAAEQLIVSAQPEVPAAAAVVSDTNTIALTVSSARDEPYWGAPLGSGTYPGIAEGDPISDYKFIINVDNAGDTDPALRDTVCSALLPNGDPNPAYPEDCTWPSIIIESSSPIVTQGDNNDLSTINTLTLPDGDYVISVVSDDFKIDGQWFTLPMSEDAEGSGVATVDVVLQPYPLPASTIRIKVFEDTALPNSAPDIPAEGLANGDPQENTMAGFNGHVGDWGGEVTTDIFGNPLCTEYKTAAQADTAAGEVAGPYDYAYLDGAPVPLPGTGGECLSDELGNIVIPNLSTNRYETFVTPPDGTNWQQTTTLEGNKPWDTWTIEGDTGYDSEFVIAGEPFPFVIFGFVQPMVDTTIITNTNTGVVEGTVAVAEVYIPFSGGLDYQGHLWAGLSGSKIREIVPEPWIALSDLQNGDRAVWIGQGDANGNFRIEGVPPGDYLISWWDGPQMNHFDWKQITVGPGDNGTGETSDLGVMFVTGWWTKIWGTVFDDTNQNGYRDAGEHGLHEFPLVIRKRENAELDRGAVAAVTDGGSCIPGENDDAGACFMFENTYPYNQWLILEFFDPGFVTTGYTYETPNMEDVTDFHPSDALPGLPGVTILGDAVDIGIMPIIGQSMQIDIGVRQYDDGENGGIAGTVFYDQTRTWYEPNMEAPEPWGTGISGLELELWSVVTATTKNDVGHDVIGYQLAEDGSFKTGRLLATTTTETWQRPTGCYAYDVEGNRVDNEGGTLIPSGDLGVECIEPMQMGSLVENGFTTVDGNYGFSDIMYDAAGNLLDEAQWTPLPKGEYLVRVVIPNDEILGNPLYQVTREEDLNVYSGNEYRPQQLPLESANGYIKDGIEAPPPFDQTPPPDFPICAGALHTVDVADVGDDNYPETQLTDGATYTVTIPASTPVVNPGFADDGGSPYEGKPTHYCDMKLVQVLEGRAVAPAFTLFTEVPVAGRWWGLILDDLTLSTNPAEWTFGEKMGIPNAPIGVYDFTGRLVRTIESDPNGMFSALMPSTTTFNASSPSGMQANMFRLVGNDPGQPGRLNAGYNPQYRTISANFEVIPGNIVIADLAPTQIAVSIQSPGTTFSHVAMCALDETTPQLYAVDKPYVYKSGNDADRTINIIGAGFGDVQGVDGAVMLDNQSVDVVNWSDRQITVMVPGAPQVFKAGTYQLGIRTDGGQELVNGLTIHILGPSYNPTVYEVGAGKAYDPWTTNPETGVGYTVQDALDDAANDNGALVVVYNKMDPNDPTTQEQWNPRGVYYENLVMYAPIKLQGVGPGGVYTDANGNITDYVLGSTVNGMTFSGDTGTAANWRDLVAGLNITGYSETIYEGAVITVFATSKNQFQADADGKTNGAIDGLTIEGGNQQGFPANFNQVGGANTGPAANITIQGGGIYVNGYARGLQISNNIMKSNGGAYGAAVRLGTPNLPDNVADAQNDDIKILYNQIVANGGTNLAGGIGIFEGSEGYEIAFNNICGNYTTEYGGGISHYGYSPNGSIHNNRIYFNHANDEGGGVMIAGELSANPGILSPGAGPVDVYNNIIQSNMSNDDGGGLRFLMPGDFEYNVYNNMIMNNVSTHEGGGVALIDAPNVNFFNNTVVKNLTTATAVTSNGQPAPAGLSTARNSYAMQATLPAGAPLYSDPLMFNNIFWDNRAGEWDGNFVHGLGLTGDTLPVYNWDMGTSDGGYLFSPTSSIIQTRQGLIWDASNLPSNPNDPSVDPLITELYDTSVTVLPWRTNPNFVGVLLTAVELPPTLMGDYHLQANSPAIDAGANSSAGVDAPSYDIDGDFRATGTIDIGADEAGMLSQFVQVVPGAAQYRYVHQLFLPFVSLD